MVTLDWAGGTGRRAVGAVRREARWAAAAGFDGFRIAGRGAAGWAAYVAAGVTDLRVAAAAPSSDADARTREGLAVPASARGWL